MKVVALMGSPRKGGNTDLLTDEFIAGAEPEGAQCEKISVAALAGAAHQRYDLHCGITHGCSASCAVAVLCVLCGLPLSLVLAVRR